MNRNIVNHPLVRLLRVPNLLIIVLTQVLLRFCIIRPFLYSGSEDLISSVLDFILLGLATVLVAAGGNVINDYFDVAIDRVNKPGKNPVTTEISEPFLLRFYWIINGTAWLMGSLLAYRVHSLTLALLFPFITLLLWFYSARYKRTLLIGNLIISLLSAMVLFIVWYTEFLHLQMNPDHFVIILPNMRVTLWFLVIYSAFAFTVTLVREIVKDLEDLPGDKENGCSTLPVAVGVRMTKMILTVIVGIVLILIIYCCWMALMAGHFGILVYLLAVVGGPLIYLLIKLFPSGTADDFHFLSSLSKVIMVAGILTMQLISVFN